jgi:hypothetical protein
MSPGLRVGVVGCVKQKLATPAQACEFYTSSLFRGRRAFVERTCERWYVLSALHGLVEPESVLEPYDVSLARASRSERRKWSAMVVRSLGSSFSGQPDLQFEVHAGADYREFGLVDGLHALGAEVVVPAAGLTQGEQLRFYKAASRE